MKISVLCASRNNASNLRTIIGALDMLQSGKNDIKYIIGCDLDDDDTKYVKQEKDFYRNYPPLDLRMDGVNLDFCFAGRSSNLGATWNRIAKESHSELYAIVTDRALCITPHWDLYLADIYSKDDTKVFWWKTNAGPVIPIAPRKWLEAAGQLYTEYFPFWFDDTWLQELSILVHGLPIYGTQATCFIAKKNPMTNRMRDLRFWMDFFIAKRPERIVHAEKIRKKLGLHEPDVKPIEEWLNSNEDLWDKEWKNWEKIAGDKSEPDETYIVAKKSAEEFLNAHNR